MFGLFDFIADLSISIQLLIYVGVALIGATLVTLPVFWIIQRNGERWDSETLRSIRRRLRTPVFFLLATFFTLILWREYPNNDLQISLRPVVTTLAYIFAAWFLIRCIAVGANAIRHQYGQNVPNNLQERKILTQLQYLQRIAGIVIVIVAISLILLQFKEFKQLGTGLLASAGVTSLIIGLAAQKSIANLLAGFQIAFTQPIRLDDVVVIEGEWGRIEEITLTYVVVRSWDQRRIVVPLQYFNDNIFQNWTKTSSDLTGAIFLFADFSLPVQELRDELDRVLENHEKWDGRVKGVQVIDVEERVMKIRILVSAKDSGTTFDLRCDVREHMISFIRENYPGALPRLRMDLESKPGDSGERISAISAPRTMPRTASPAPEDGKEETAEQRRQQVVK